MTSALDPREALLAAAERLFAEHGPDGTSLRDIARAAGQRNNSAVHYHFGSRDNLLVEVFRRRMADINTLREQRLVELDATGEEASVVALVAVLLEPLAEHLRSAGRRSTYAQFMVRTMSVVDFDREPIAEVNAVQHEIAVRMRRLLPALSATAFERRVTLALTMAVAALADLEHRWNLGAADEAALDDTVAEVVTMTAAALQAPSPTPGRTTGTRRCEC